MKRTAALLLLAFAGCEAGLGEPSMPRTASAQETLWLLFEEQVKLDSLRPLLDALKGKSFAPGEVDELSDEILRAAEQVVAASNQGDKLRAARYRADVVGVAYDLIRVHAEAQARGFGGVLNRSCGRGMELIHEARQRLKENPRWPIESPMEATRMLDLASAHAENAMRVAPIANFMRSGVTAASVAGGTVALARLTSAGIAGLGRLIRFMKSTGATGGALAVELSGGTGSVRLLAGSGVLVLSRAEILALAKAGAISTAALSLYMMATHLHHIATNKNYTSTSRGGPWSTRFEKIFKDAGMTLDDEANLVEVSAHQGPHSEAYHREVYQVLNEATKDISPGTPQFQAALKNALRQLARRIQTPGSDLNRLVTATGAK